MTPAEPDPEQGTDDVNEVDDRLTGVSTDPARCLIRRRLQMV